MEKTDTTEQALLTNHKLKPQVRSRPSESTTLATKFFIYCSAFAIRMQRDRGLAEASVVQYICALSRRHISQHMEARDRLIYTELPRGYLACTQLDRMRRSGKLCDVRILLSSPEFEC
uniref:Cdc6_C domain-containing protein n=1 Tax=Mesocestoides corti TaxID=53468 RepID=A0A5K3G3D0_MESCO